MNKKETGQMCIFLGYAAGVGKTYAMLEAAHDLKKAVWMWLPDILNRMSVQRQGAKKRGWKKFHPFLSIIKESN